MLDFGYRSCNLKLIKCCQVSRHVAVGRRTRSPKCNPRWSAASSNQSKLFEDQPFFLPLGQRSFLFQEAIRRIESTFEHGLQSASGHGRPLAASQTAALNCTSASLYQKQGGRFFPSSMLCTSIVTEPGQVVVR